MKQQKRQTKQVDTKTWYINQVKRYLQEKHLNYEIKEAQTNSIYIYMGDMEEQYRPVIRIADHKCGNGNVRTLRCDQGIKNATGKIRDLRKAIDTELLLASVRKCRHIEV